MVSGRFRSRMDLSSLKKALREFENMPTPEMQSELGRVLDRAFATTQENVHVDTGALRASGERAASEYGGEWRGRINYGKGVHYAQWEFSRDGHHPYEGLNRYEDEFEEAVARAIRRA